MIFQEFFMKKKQFSIFFVEKMDLFAANGDEDEMSSPFSFFSADA